MSGFTWSNAYVEKALASRDARIAELEADLATSEEDRETNLIRADRAEAEVARLREALQFYADAKDGFIARVAREALGGGQLLGDHDDNNEIWKALAGGGQ